MASHTLSIETSLTVHLVARLNPKRLRILCYWFSNSFFHSKETNDESEEPASLTFVPPT